LPHRKCGKKLYIWVALNHYSNLNSYPLIFFKKKIQTRYEKLQNQTKWNTSCNLPPLIAMAKTKPEVEQEDKAPE
jgi:hypothetical protein